MLQRAAFLKNSARAIPSAQAENCFKTYSQPNQQEHDGWHNIFSRAAPEVALDFPFPDGAVPLQQDGAGRTQQSEGCRRPSIERTNPAELDLPAAQENDVRRQMAPENEQSIEDTERLALPRQKPHRPFQGRVAGQQDADGGVQGEDGKADGQDEPGLHLSQLHRQDTGRAPQSSDGGL